MTMSQTLVALEWQERAACAVMPNALQVFFEPDGGEGQVRRRVRIKTAKQTCHGCPVIRDCLQYALEDGISEGVWGGLTPEDRKLVGRGVSADELWSRDYLVYDEGLPFGAAAALARNRCPRNHELTPDNVRVWRGKRICKACHRERKRERTLRVVS